MDMEMEVNAEQGIDALVQRLTVAAAALEHAAAAIAERGIDLQATAREAQLERLLAEAEAQLAALKSQRKTQPGGVATLVAREAGTPEPGALDTALASLSVEQRIAVKSQMLRAGLIG